MHPVLRIQEILINIFGHTYDPPTLFSRDKAPGATLARLARTCKCFSYPALDILWYTQPSLFNLLKCLPDRAIVVDKKTDRTVILKISPNIEDYARLSIYATRIKELGKASPWAQFYPLQRNEINNLVYSGLLSQRLHSGLGPLLPNLRYLEIDMIYFTGQAAYPRVVVGPKLSIVNLEFVHQIDDEAENALWSNVAAIMVPYAPAWRKFTFAEHRIMSEVQYESLSAMVLCRSFFGLDTLLIANLVISHDVLCHIATMPHLRELKFRISSQDLVAFTETASSPEEFRSIRLLSVFTGNLPPCTALLSRPPFIHLQELRVGQSEDGGIWELEPFITNLKTPNLESLVLRKLKVMYVLHELDPTPFTRRMLSSLLSSPFIHRLEIDFSLLVSLDDSDLKAMSSTWPQLEHLSLPDHSLQSTPNITFPGLLDFAIRCKNLTHIQLRVDARNLFNCPNTGTDFRSLIDSLDFCTSPLSPSAAYNMVDLIALFFPNLSALQISKAYQGLSQHPPLPSREKCHAQAWRSVIELRTAISSRRPYFR